MSTTYPFQPLRVECSFAFIDDDQDLLEALEIAFGRTFRARFFDHPAKLDPVLERSAEFLKAEREQLLRVATEQNPNNDGHAAYEALKYFAAPWRKEIVGVLIVDYDMPAENGVVLCGRHEEFGLQRLLLTGVADEQKANVAFNLGRIEYYLGKHFHKAKPSLGELNAELKSQMVRLRDVSADRRGQSLLPMVDSDINEILQVQAAADSLRRLLDEYKVREHMMLGLPRGILALTTDKRAFWFQLETVKSRKSHLDVIADSEGEWGGDVLERVSRGESVLNFSCMGQIGLKTLERPLRIVSQAPFLAVGVTELEGLPEELQPCYW